MLTTSATGMDTFWYMIVRDIMRKGMLMGILCLLSTYLVGQTDSLEVAVEDTVNVNIVDPLNGDTIQLNFIDRAKTAVENQLPEIYREGELLKLHIPVPWREDIYVPLPHAFEKAGGRPPYDPKMA